MDARYYLVTDGKTLAIWSVEPQRFLELQKRKPQFTLINSYSTYDEADAERQKRQNFKLTQSSRLKSSGLAWHFSSAFLLP